ncbi:putative cytochrome P450 [Helianthus annuus]|nr:putative cytochrome P450 [Helianthus annuus]
MEFLEGYSSYFILNMEAIFLQALILLSPILLFIYLRFKNHKFTTQYGFTSYPLVGTVPEFLQNRHRFLDWTAEVLIRTPTHTGILDRPGKIKCFITANPANVEHMVKTNFDNYPKGTRFISLLEELLGQGIFNAEGESWRAQRKIASYEFNTRSLRNFVMEAAAIELHDRFIPILEKAADVNRVFDLQNILERYTFDNICKVAFNFDPCCLSGDGISGSEFMSAFEEATTLITQRFLSLFPGDHKIRKFFKFRSEIKLEKAVVTVHKFADEIIKKRMSESDRKTDEDLLSRFMGNSDYSPEFLRDIVISFILAGRDTTSSALSWFFWLLSWHPEVEQKILDELESIRRSSGKSFSDSYCFDDLRHMHYLHAALSESLRLYPPVPLETKDCLKDDIMPDGTFIGEGWFVSYNAYAMARLESVWGKDCCEFRPERWLEEDGQGNVVYRPENPFKFPVFHGGPRICLGKEMAYTQMKLVAATIVEKFRVEMVATEAKKQPEHVIALTIRMKDGLKVRVMKR